MLPARWGAARSVLRDMLYLLEDGATHLGVATDHVIESFRNDLYDGYKSGEGLDPLILGQFQPLEDGLRALGITLFPMVEFEADDAMGAAAIVAAADPRVDRVLICTPDKDLAQVVQEGRIVQFDRRREKISDVADVIEKYGVPPESIPDYLGLVGDTADGLGARAERLGCEVGRCGAEPIRPHREHPDRRRSVGHHRARWLEAGRHAGREPR
ncbi:MAG: hypothetical protein R2710_10070 [Acidimicrobiales bacterium]